MKHISEIGALTLKPFSIVSLDIKKAFETVRHFSLLGGLQRMGLDIELAEYILKDLSLSSTTIKMGNKSTKPIEIRNGVKQEDPLSSILFNLVLDEVIG